MQWLITTALIAVALTSPESQDVQMSGFSFQLPSTWTVKTDAHYKLIASLSATFDQNVFPWVTVNICDDNSDHRCPLGDLDLSKDKDCPGIEHSTQEWANGIKENRWVCPLLTGPTGLKGSSSVTMFRLGKRELMLYYLAADHDTPPTEFLDKFAKSLRSE